MIQEAGVDGRKRRGSVTREITYQKVLLAVYMASDEEGLTCYTYFKSIARDCGVSPVAVGRAVAEMERRGVLVSFDWRDGLCCRVSFLMDHPKAKRGVRQMRKECGPRRK